MQDNNIEQDLSEYLKSLNAQKEEENQAAAQKRHQADAQREAEINSLSNLFIKKEGTING